MANTPFDDLGTEEILSTRISGIQDAVKNIEQSLNMDTEAVSNESLTLLADAMGIYRIAEAVGKRNWLDSPAPVIEQYIGGSWTQISTGFTIDYAGGAVIFTEDKVGEQFRASFTRVKNTSGYNSHKSDYAQHGVTMGHENDLYIAKIGSFFGFTPLEVNYGGTIYAIAADDEFVYVGGGTTQTVRKLRKSDLSQVAESANYGGNIYAIATDDEFVYVGGGTTRTVRVIENRDLIKIIRRYQ